MREIPLTQGRFAIVDDGDYKNINQHSWHFDNGYATRTKKKIAMHRVIAETPTGMITDHINGNGLDNRRCNLRICSRSQNAVNAKVRSNNKLGVTGISMKQGKYYVQVMKHGEYLYRGYFNTLSEAVLKRNEVAAVGYGEYYKPSIIKKGGHH